MADFRKLFVVLAVAVLFTSTASAVDYYCNASSVPTLVRAEGIAEMMGDVKLDCQGDIPNPSAGLVVNIRLTLSTNITSRLLQDRIGTGGTAKKTNQVTEATLVLDRGEPFGFWGYQTIGNNSSGSGNALLPYSDGRQNVYQAVKISDTEVEWQGVVLAAPGSTEGVSQILLTDVRGNASAVGAGAPIMATINITTPSSLTINSNNPVVANTRTGLTFSVTAANFKTCVGIGAAPSGNAAPTVATYLTFAEGFNTAFRPQINNLEGTGPYNFHDVPGGAFADESGFNPVDFDGSLAGGSLIGLTTIGLATQGTQLRARITGVPSGVSLGAPLEITTDTGLVLDLVDGSASGTFTNTTPITSKSGSNYSADVGDITLDSSGNGTVVYEVVEYVSGTTAPSLQDTVYIPIAIAYSKPATPGSSLVSGSFAPLSTLVTMSLSAPVPRFIDTGVDKAFINLTLCRTILLFPDITNQAGFDTGIAISNTSADPFLTTGQAGACGLYYYGNTNGAAGPAAQTTPSVPAGGQLLMLLSTGGSVLANGGGTATACASGNCLAPGFQGYMIAVCNFQYAHGFAYISDVGATKLAQGYLALIIPDVFGTVPVTSSSQKDKRPPDPFSTSASGTGEMLAQ